MTLQIERRLTKLETAQATTVVPGWVAVASLDDLTDDQRDLIARYRVTLFVGVSPDDWDRDDLDGAIL